MIRMLVNVYKTLDYISGFVLYICIMDTIFSYTTLNILHDSGFD